ncbi:MAG TPA: hypothetical protein VK890_08675 [Bacteroidia bacterium]|jgi:hypothetical protein|nr:hypothetical protein [Bacteroidia bacterium]
MEIKEQIKKHKWLKWLLILAVVALIIWGVYKLFNLQKYKVDEATLQSDIQQAASAYGSNSGYVTKILTDGTYEIQSHPFMLDAAYQYSQANGVTMEQAVLTSAIAYAKSMGYLS